MTIEHAVAPASPAGETSAGKDRKADARRASEAAAREEPGARVEPERPDVGGAGRGGSTVPPTTPEVALDPLRDAAADPAGQRLWVPDNADGSGWADVDWASAARGSRYHYRHAEPLDVARETAPAFYRIVTRLESPSLAPHENSYYVPRDRLADLLAELSFAGGAEVIWHVEPSPNPPPECGVG